MTRKDLQKFCEYPEGIHPDLQSPWSAGDYTYASDGVVIVRVPRLAYVPENPGAPKTGFLDTKSRALGWFDIPELHGGACPHCDGTGRIFRVEQFVEIGPAKLRCIPLAILQTLPGVQIGPTGEESIALVRFDGGDGAIMPRSK